MYSGVHPTAYPSPGDQQQALKRIIKGIVPAGKDAVIPGDAAIQDGNPAEYNDSDQRP
jgi:hypothetical protein